MEEVFILHLSCSHDIIDIEKEATVDGCPLHVSQNDREVWALGGHFFVLLSLPRVYPREKQAIAKLMTSMTVLYIFVSSMQIPSFQLRSAAERQSLWRAYKIPPSIKTQFDAEGNRLPLVAIGSRNAPDIFIIAYL